MTRHSRDHEHAHAWADDLRLADRVTGGLQQAMITRLAPVPGTRVLDAGCGAGWFTALLADAVGPDGTVVALDVDPAALDATRATVTEHDVAHRVEVLEGDILGRRDDLHILSAYSLHTGWAGGPGAALR